MATKAGRAQFKDIKVGRVLWRVYAMRLPASGVCIRDLERVTVVEKPFRTVIMDDGVCRPEWSFTIQFGQGFWDPGTMRTYDCSDWGIQTDVSSNKPIGLSFLFTTEAHARRYIDRVQNYRLADAYEHPRQFTKVGFGKPISKRSSQGLTFGTARYIRPYQFVMGGVVCDHTTPKEYVSYFLRESTKELSQMYPHVIEPLVPKDAKITALGSLEKLKYDDPEVIVGYDPAGPAAAEMSVARDSEGKIHVTHVVIGNGDKITHSSGKSIVSRGIDRHLRGLHRQLVLVPKSVTEDPLQRAQLEKDFVIIDEVHQVDALKMLKTEE